MAQTVEVNLVDVLTRLESKIDKLTEDVAQLKAESTQTNKRLDEVNSRLNTVTLGVFGLIGVLVTGLLTFIGKLVFFPKI